MSWFRDRIDWLAAPWHSLSDLQVQITQLQLQHVRMETRMSKNSDALAALDAQIDELEAYVLSDDETDAGEVQARVQRLKDVLAGAKGDAPAEEPAPVEEPAAGAPADPEPNPAA